MVKDIYNSVQRYQNGIKKLSNNTKINPENRAMFLEWLSIKEDELKRRKGADEVAQIRYCKTMGKYLYLLKGTEKLFKGKDLKTLTESDIKNLYLDLEEGRIKLAKSTRKDYYNKIFKSDFFEFIGKKELAKKIITLESSSDEEVKYFELKDLELMVQFTNSSRNALFLYFLFDTGMRIGEVLNLKVGDVELRHNKETKRDYYIVHIGKDITKSKATRHIPLMLDKTNTLIEVYLKGQTKDSLLFDFGYTNARMLISRVTRKAKIKTKPEGKEVSIHDFRKSSATYFLSKGYNIDFVKSRLGHKPSSGVIDRYVNYLGLNEAETITMAQSQDYSELQASYKEAVERIKTMDANQKEMRAKLESQQKQQERFEEALEILDLHKKVKAKA